MRLHAVMSSLLTSVIIIGFLSPSAWSADAIDGTGTGTGEGEGFDVVPPAPLPDVIAAIEDHGYVAGFDRLFAGYRGTMNIDSTRSTQQGYAAAYGPVVATQVRNVERPMEGIVNADIAIRFESGVLYWRMTFVESPSGWIINGWRWSTRWLDHPAVSESSSGRSQD